MGIARFVAALALASLFAGPASAYIVKFSVECPDVLTEDSDPNYREMNRWWLMGYFTGRNYVNDADTGDGIDPEDIYDMALEFCRDNPGSDWDDAAIHVYDMLD